MSFKAQPAQIRTGASTHTALLKDGWRESKLRDCGLLHAHRAGAGTCVIPAQVRSMCVCPMFSSSCTLPSPTSAATCVSLFGWFTGTTMQSDFSNTCMSVVRFMAFTDRPSHIPEGVLEISRFSCMLFLGVHGLLDYAGPDSHSR